MIAGGLVPFIVVENYVSRVGSSVTGNSPNDNDILVRDEPDALIVDALSKALNLPGLHFIFEPKGPTSNYVPLYDATAMPVAWQEPPLGVLLNCQFISRLPDPGSTPNLLIRASRSDSGIEIKLSRIMGIPCRFIYDPLAQTPPEWHIYSLWLIPKLPVEINVEEPYYSALASKMSPMRSLQPMKVGHVSKTIEDLWGLWVKDHLEPEEHE